MARRLHGLSFFVVLMVTTVTTAMPDDGAQEGNCPTTASPGGDALLQASSVLQANAVVVEVTKAESSHLSSEIEEMRIGAVSSSDLSNDPDVRSYEEMNSVCDVLPLHCHLFPNCEIDLRDLECVPKGSSVQAIKSDTSNCSDVTPAHCAERKGCEVAPNMMCVPKQTSVGSLLEKRSATRTQAEIHYIPDHERCTPMYPDLYVYLGAMGDLCRTRGLGGYRFSCPDGCTSLENGKWPGCVDSGTGNHCRVHQTQGEVTSETPGWYCSGQSLHTHSAVTGAESENIVFPSPIREMIGDPRGNYCTTPSVYHPSLHHWSHTYYNWIAPLGCRATDSLPYSKMNDNKPCRVPEGTPNGARAVWRLLASGTHGVSATMEVGMTYSNSSSNTREGMTSFGMEVKAGAKLGYDHGGDQAEIDVTVSGKLSEMIGMTIDSLLSQSEVHTVTVECPDYFDSPTNVIHVANSRIELIWQFVVSNGDVIAKTDHFRCHHSKEGERFQMPQCLPQLCQDDLCQPPCGVP